MRSRRCEVNEVVVCNRWHGACGDRAEMQACVAQFPASAQPRPGPVQSVPHRGPAVLQGPPTRRVPAGEAAAPEGRVEGRMALAVVAATTGMTLFEGATEIARTRLAALPVGIAVLVRAVLVLTLGSLSLWLTRDPVWLALAVASANVIASLPP